MGIADGLSRLPSHLIQRALVEDSDGLRPKPSITTCGQAGVDIIVTPNILLAMAWRIGMGTDGSAGGRKEQGGGVAVVVGEGEQRGGDVRDAGESLEAAAREIKRRKWRKWLDSGFYGGVVRVKLEGVRAKEELDLGCNEWRTLEQRTLEQRARRFVMVDGREARLFWREGDGQLAMCVLEGEVGKVLRDLQDGHVHFAAGLTAGRAHGQHFWPTRQKDIGRWVALCEPY